MRINKTVLSKAFKSSFLIGITAYNVFTAPITSHASVNDPLAIQRFDLSLKELQDLDMNWDNFVKGQGDNIRRCLGTVYTPPVCDKALCSYPSFIKKFVQAHPDDLDVSSFEEPMAIVLEAINQADFLAYSSVFSDYGNGGGGKNYIEDSHSQIKRAIQSLKEAIDVIKK